MARKPVEQEIEKIVAPVEEKPELSRQELIDGLSRLFKEEIISVYSDDLLKILYGDHIGF